MLQTINTFCYQYIIFFLTLLNLNTQYEGHWTLSHLLWGLKLTFRFHTYLNEPPLPQKNPTLLRDVWEEQIGTLVKANFHLCVINTVTEDVEKPITSVWRNKRNQPSMDSMDPILNNKYIIEYK